MASDLIRLCLITMALILSRCVAGGMPERIARERDGMPGATQQRIPSETARDQCQTIKALILAHKRADAAAQLGQLLHGVGTAEEAVEAADQVLRMAADLESAGYQTESRDVEKQFVAFLAEQPRDRPVSYRTLQEAFFRGQNGFLIDYGRDVKTQDWRSHRLMAEAAADEFIGLMHPGPDKKTRDQLKGIARVCTSHYEAAVLRAPNQYVKTQIACGWLAMIANHGGNFGVDSALLRKQLPTDPAFECTASQESIHAQVERFGAATRAAISSGKQGQLFDEESRERIMGAFVKQFEEYARIGIPDAVFDRMVKDVAFFFDKGMPMGRIGALNTARLEALAPMFKWYLWRAILCDTADEVEQGHIQVQIDGLAKHCRDALTDPKLPNELLRSAESSLEEFKRQHAELRDNRFLPYFKRVLSKNRFNKTLAHLVQGCENMKANARDLAGRRLDRDLGREQSMMDARIRSYGHATLMSLFNTYSGWDRPLRTPLPDWIIGADSSEVNEYGIFAFLPRLGDPFPAD